VYACPSTATRTAAALAAQAEDVCRHYLPAGKRQGRYWVVGDIDGSPGHSLIVRLRGPGKPGKFTDMATGDHGDLLDIIRRRSRCSSLAAALSEARSFLALPSRQAPAPPGPAKADPSGAALRLWRYCRPIDRTHAEAYLQARGIDRCRFASLRFHPKLRYRDPGSGAQREYPGLVAAVTNAAGRLTGVLRTYLDPDRPTKANVPAPKKALGPVYGQAVRFGPANARPDPVLIVGEGIETVLSLLTAYPGVAGAAALSAGSLGAFIPPRGWRIAIARDAGRHGAAAADNLAKRCARNGIRFRVLAPALADFNEDLAAGGADAIRQCLGCTSRA